MVFSWHLFTDGISGDNEILIEEEVIQASTAVTTGFYGRPLDAVLRDSNTRESLS